MLNFLLNLNTTPRFNVDGENIKILDDPQDFYKELLRGIKSSKRQISFFSLYLGTGEKENVLVDCLQKAIVSNPDMKVNILLDRSRGTRKTSAGSSASLLSKLIPKQNENNVNISFFKMPQLDKAPSKMPGRLNEVIAVQHIKAYVMDDTIVISGANLSEDYFTNRQDRYVVISKSPELTNWYHELNDILSFYSDRLTFSGELQEKKKHHSYKDLKMQLIKLYTKRNEKIESVETDTFILPTLQCKPLGIRYDEDITNSILQQFSNGNLGTIDLATGYLNLVQSYKIYLATCLPPSVARIITASPQANGFHSAKGIAAGIPMAYSEIEKDIYKTFKLHNSPVTIHEYVRDKWTFHCKGMWITNSKNGEKYPSVTLIGSPNFGIRSVDRDLESQIVIATKNISLQKKLFNEVNGIMKYTEAVNENTWKRPDRTLKGTSWKHGYYIRYINRLIRPFL